MREGLGLTQEQLAEKLSISSQAVSKWETSQSVPDTMLLPAISSVFGITIDELFRENRENYDSLASKLAAIYEDTNKKEDFQQADLAYTRLFSENKYTTTDLFLYGCMYRRYAWHCFHVAEDSFNKVLAMTIDESDKTYALALGRLIELKGDMKQSQQMLNEMKDKYAASPDSSFLRQMLIAAGAQEWSLYQSKGDLLYNRGLLTEALKCFEKAWSIDSATYCDTLYSLLCVYKKLGNKEKAIATCHEWLVWYEERGATIEKKTVERELESLQ